MIFFSQLDLIRILERALRRSNLPLFYTQGFNPHVKISFAGGLKLGIVGTVPTTFYFAQPTTFADLTEKLSPQLPKGLSLQKTKNLL